MERFENLLNGLRNEISCAIVALVSKHGVDKINIYDEYEDKPIIVESFNDSNDTMTMESISIIDAEHFDVTCSNNYNDNDTFSNKVISTDLLLDLYKWLVENESDIF